MSANLAWVLIGLGAVVLVVRQRLPTVAVGAVTLQSLLLVGMAFYEAAGVDDTIAAVALAARSVGLAVFFLLLITHTREPRPIPDRVPLPVRLGLAGAVSWSLIALVPDFGLASRPTQRAVLTLMALGLLVAATRQATLFQILGVVMVENGLVLGALQLVANTSWFIEIGVAFDLTVVAVVAGVFHRLIFFEHGTTDSAALRNLRDS
jgi:hydrogenase-4 membrane subunit HyfE